MQNFISNGSFPSRRIRSDVSPLVISVETNPYNSNTYDFVKTLINNNWDYEIVGLNKAWEGFGSKIKYFSEYLRSLNKDRIVILSDSRDVFCVRSPEHFITAFEQFNKPILVSLEMFCQGYPDDSAVRDPKNIWQCVPLNDYWKSLQKIPSYRKYVNSGLIVGRVEALIEHYDWVKTTKWDDDQAALGDYMNKFPDKIAADIEAEVIHTSSFGVSGSTFTRNQWKDSPSFAELTGKLNYFLHIPGINGVKGQKAVYNMVRKLVIEYNVSNDWLYESYDFTDNEKKQWKNGIYDYILDKK